MTPSTSRHVGDPVADHSANECRASAQVLPLVRAGLRRSRREASESAGPRGQILLFTGIRYERMPDAPAGLSDAPAGPQRKHC